MRINSFIIEIEELTYDNRKEKIKSLNKLRSYREDCNNLYHEFGPENDVYKNMLNVVKTFKEKYNEMDKVFYNISIGHKKIDEKVKNEFIEYNDIKSSIQNLCSELQTNLQRKREKQRHLTKRKKSGRVKLKGNKNSIVFLYYLTGLVHNKSNTFLRLKNKNLVRKFFNSKKPENKNNHIGVEMEFYIQGSREDLAMALFNEDMELSNKIEIKDDGSLRPKDNEKDIELAIIDTEENICKTIKKVEKVLKEFEPRIGKACGLHVHIDMRNRIAELCFHNLVKTQNILYKMQPKEREENQYCKKTSSSNIYKMLRQGERYLGVNPHSMEKHRSIEIRLHEGSIKAKDINNWIKLLINVCNIKDKINTNYRSIKSICKDYGFKQEVETYVESRIKKYEEVS